MTISRLLFAICIDIIDVTLDRIEQYLEQRDKPVKADKVLYVVTDSVTWKDIVYN